MSITRSSRNPNHQQLQPFSHCDRVHLALPRPDSQTSFSARNRVGADQQRAGAWDCRTDLDAGWDWRGFDRSLCDCVLESSLASLSVASWFYNFVGCFNSDSAWSSRPCIQSGHSNSVCDLFLFDPNQFAKCCCRPPTNLKWTNSLLILDLDRKIRRQKLQRMQTRKNLLSFSLT